MKVTVIGKFRKQGVSRKTGEVYDICNAYVTHPLRGAEGLVSEKLFLSPEQFDFDGIQRAILKSSKKIRSICCILTGLKRQGKLYLKVNLKIPLEKCVLNMFVE